MKQQTTSWIYCLIIMLAFCMMLSGCNKDHESQTSPVVTTGQISNVTPTSATCGGDVISQGVPALTSRGVCWSIFSNPTISDAHTNDGGGAGIFSSRITGLIPNTTYYVRAYATNSFGTGYGTETSFPTPQSSTGIVTDTCGNVYHTITIGTQVWMIENLKTSKFNDGLDIRPVADFTEWDTITIPGYCLYLDDPENKNIYGALYNWYCIHTGKLAPKGWQVPNETDWTVLINFLGGASIAGGKLKESGTLYWNPNSTSLGTNDFGFTALPGGYRSGTGLYLHSRDYGCWWSFEEPNGSDKVFYRSMNYDNPEVNLLTIDKGYGFSVRCMRYL
jgi:uncharacterized protein (TIGR02145 family)